MFDEPMPFHRAQKLLNDQYYASRPARAQTPIGRLGFETPSHDIKYAQANAKEFIDFAKKRAGLLRIHEFGAADGTFALNFLNFLKDNAFDVYQRVEYKGWDKHSSLLSSAEKSLRRHKGAKFGELDIEEAGSRLGENSADWVFCHELFDDLPTRIVVNNNNRLNELWSAPLPENHPARLMGMIGIDMQHRPLEEDEHYEQTIKVMKKMPKAIRVTIPIGGAKAMKQISQILTKGGVARIFDYGFMNYQVLPKFANTAARGNMAGNPWVSIMKDGYAFVGAQVVERQDGRGGIGGLMEDMQISTLVNFPYLSHVAKKLGMKTKVEPMTLWAQKTLGKGHAFGHYYGAALGYKIPGMGETVNELKIPTRAVWLLQRHDLFKEKSALRNEVEKIIANMGDTPEALKHAEELLAEKGYRLPRGAPAKKEGETSYVMNNLANSFITVFASRDGPIARILSQARPVAPIASIDKQDISHEAKLAPEMEELEKLGFNKKDIRWAVFHLPYNYRYSGAQSRVSFTVIKK